VEGNPTTEALREIIEMLASHISAEVSDESKSKSSFLLESKGMKTSVSGSLVSLGQAKEDDAGADDEDSTLPLVLKSLHSTELSPPLRKVIAKLLPFLTYGQVSQSRELASYFGRYVDVSRLGSMEFATESDVRQEGGNDLVLMNSFVETAINLPPVSVCDNLRKELISNGFVERVRGFLLEGAPSQPPPWSPALYPKSSKKLSERKSAELREEWRAYFDRPGTSQAFRVLTGLCSRHGATQLLLSDVSGDDVIEEEEGGSEAEGEDTTPSLLTLCHWMESTSDNTAAGIKNDNGILAETLLDALKEDNDVTSEKIGAIRKKTRDRKRELAEERRNRALVGMSAFGTLAGAAVAGGGESTSPARSSAAGADTSGAESRSMFASMFSSLLAPSAASGQPRTRALSAKDAAAAQPKAAPSWMAEMEAMDDEAGVTCAVCQEGRTLQPSGAARPVRLYEEGHHPLEPGGRQGRHRRDRAVAVPPHRLPRRVDGRRRGHGGAVPKGPECGERAGGLRARHIGRGRVVFIGCFHHRLCEQQ